MRKLLMWLIIAALVGAALIYWGARELVDNIIGITANSSTTTEVAKQPADLQVDVSPVRKQPLRQQVTAVGSLLAQNAVTLRAESSGRIAKILFKEGSPTAQGALLVQLDTDLLQAELQQAQAQLNLAQSQAHRAKQLTQQGFISAQAQDETNSKRAVAAAQVAIIQAKIEKSQIKAPFDGVLGLRYVSLGDYVANGTEIVSLASLEQLQVDFRVPEQYLNQISIGTPVRLRLDAQEGREFVGEVNAISPLIDEQGRSVVLRAHVPNPDLHLRPGQFARVVLDLNEAEALMVPETALSPSGQAQYVFRVKEDNIVERIEVQVGIRRDGWVQVNGLDESDLVLITGLQKIQNGSKVRYDITTTPVSSNMPLKD